MRVCTAPRRLRFAADRLECGEDRRFGFVFPGPQKKTKPAQEGDKEPEVKPHGARKIGQAFRKAEEVLTGHEGGKK